MIPVALDPAWAARAIPLRLGLVMARIDPEAALTPTAPVLAETAARRAEALAGAAPASVPAIAATRAAYKALGKDPARYRPAAEALLRRVVQGKRLDPINPVVDVNNIVSLETGLSIGAYDIAALRPPLLCRPGGAGESYRGIGRGPLNLAGLPLLADRDGPFGCPTSDSERSATRPETCDLLMVLFDFGPGAWATLTAALTRAATLLDRHAGARSATHTVVTGDGEGAGEGAPAS